MSVGIYAILNSATGEVYVGQSVWMEHRKTEHFWALRRGSHHCVALQTSYAVHGSTAFSFLSLAECSKQELTSNEAFWMEYLAFLGLTLCNTVTPRRVYCPSPESRAARAKAMKGRKYTEEHRDNISKGLSGRQLTSEWRAKISKSLTGRPLSEETKKKMSESRTGKKHSAEAVQKRVDFHTGRKRSPETCKKISEAKRRSKCTSESKA